MTVLTKTIKPQRLRQDAMRIALLNAIRKAGTQIKTDFESTTATWEHKPKFEVVISLVGGPTVLIDTNDEIYRYVSRGTPAHDIWAGFYTGKSNKKVLAFGPSTPKTKPGVLGSGPGSRGKPDTFVPHVRHPGTKARRFDELVKKKREKWFKSQMEQAMRKVATASGHGM